MMKPIERVATTLKHEEPDKVPIFILTTVHGAHAVGKSYGEYFSNAELLAKGQLKLQEQLGHDCLYPFFYGAFGSLLFKLCIFSNIFLIFGIESLNPISCINR